MRGTPNRVAKALCAGTALCLIGALVACYFSSEGSILGTLTLGLVFGMLACAVGALVFAVGYVLYLRGEREEILGRRTLSDEEFAAQLGGSEQADIEVVRQVRKLAAERFRSIGGEKFYPGDRLEEDLHLSDAAPFVSGEFFEDMLESLGVDESELPKNTEPVVTFGDVVLLANKLRRRA